jgi:hypothetical protein
MEEHEREGAEHEFVQVDAERRKRHVSERQRPLEKLARFGEIWIITAS